MRQLFLFFSIMLFACAVKPSHKNFSHLYGKNEWGAMSNDFRHPAELEKRIEELLGTPYLWGGETFEGMDCSAFVMQVFAIYGLSLPRTSILQSKIGMEIPRHALLPGDLVFFGELGTDSVTHVGIYMGNNKFANATSSEGVKYSDLSENFFFSRYLFAKRLLW